MALTGASGKANRKRRASLELATSTHWTDQTSSVAAFTDRQIGSGYAFDATHVVLGSETGKIISNF